MVVGCVNVGIQNAVKKGGVYMLYETERQLDKFKTQFIQFIKMWEAENAGATIQFRDGMMKTKMWVEE